MNNVIFTNGCFDILHYGHFKLLEYCKSLGSTLLVGINSDSSIRKIKGDNRPINNEKIRKFNLECIKFVDKVFIFEETTPMDIMLKLKPDIIVKGGDYKIDQIVGSDIFDVRIFKYVEGFSTTKQLKRFNNGGLLHRCLCIWLM